MKSILSFVVGLILSICILCRCGSNNVIYLGGECIMGLPPLFMVSDVYCKLDDTFTLLELKAVIHSPIPFEAYLILRLEKEIKREGAFIERYEGFKDSLKIDGFDIRSHLLVDATSPFDYPVYIKKISVKKGTSQVFIDNIVLPKNYSGIANLSGQIGVLRIDDEIIKNFEKYPEGFYKIEWDNNIPEFEDLPTGEHYLKEYLNAFPDSSMVSLVFSDFEILRLMSFLDRGEYTACECFPEKTAYLNFSSFHFVIYWCKPFGYSIARQGEGRPCKGYNGI